MVYQSFVPQSMLDDGLRRLHECLGLVGTAQGKPTKRNPLLIAIDFENGPNIEKGFRKSQHSQVGLAILDPQDLPAAIERDVICTYNFISGSKAYRKRKASFLFGDPIFIEARELRQTIESLLPRDRDILLVGHSVENEIRVLQALGFNLTTRRITGFLDTFKIAIEVFNMSAGTLGGLLDVLSIPHGMLHNGGNDAHFTLKAAVALATRVSDRVSTRSRTTTLGAAETLVLRPHTSQPISHDQELGRGPDEINSRIDTAVDKLKAMEFRKKPPRSQRSKIDQAILSKLSPSVIQARVAWKVEGNVSKKARKRQRMAANILRKLAQLNNVVKSRIKNLQKEGYSDSSILTQVEVEVGAGSQLMTSAIQDNRSQRARQIAKRGRSRKEVKKMKRDLQRQGQMLPPSTDGPAKAQEDGKSILGIMLESPASETSPRPLASPIAGYEQQLEVKTTTKFIGIAAIGATIPKTLWQRPLPTGMAMFAEDPTPEEQVETRAEHAVRRSARLGER